MNLIVLQSFLSIIALAITGMMRLQANFATYNKLSSFGIRNLIKGNDAQSKKIKMPALMNTGKKTNNNLLTYKHVFVTVSIYKHTLFNQKSI